MLIQSIFQQHVRRAAVLALSTAAHNKPNLIKGLLPELLPLLYDQTVIKVWYVFTLFGLFVNEAFCIHWECLIHFF